MTRVNCVLRIFEGNINIRDSQEVKIYLQSTKGYRKRGWQVRSFSFKCQIRFRSLPQYVKTIWLGKPWIHGTYWNSEQENILGGRGDIPHGYDKTSVGIFYTESNFKCSMIHSLPIVIQDFNKHSNICRIRTGFILHGLLRHDF